MRHGLAGCFTPGPGLWAGRLHSDWSCDRHRVPRPSQIDPLLSYARSSSMTARCRNLKFEVEGEGHHHSGCCH